MRLWPPAVFNERIAMQDVVLQLNSVQGETRCLVPRGTHCHLATDLLHRRKDLYGEDADEFRPERWESLQVSYVEPGIDHCLS